MFDLVLITMLATAGIAVKPVISPIAHVISGPYIPGGVVAGGLYMFWIVLGCALINKIGTATLIALVQALLVIVLGGGHGVMSIFTYTLPGISVDFLLYLMFKNGVHSPMSGFLAGAVANVSGSFLVSLIFFDLPWIPLLLYLCAASLSGGIGGIIAYCLAKKLKKFNFIN